MKSMTFSALQGSIFTSLIRLCRTFSGPILSSLSTVRMISPAFSLMPFMA